nr:ABC transporter substrate-binding protein [Dactylosporangium thailandense]
MKTTSRRFAIGLIGLAVLVPAAAACGDDPAPAILESGKPFVVEGETIATQELVDAAVKEGTLTLYTGLNEVTTRAVNEAFTADTGIKVEFVRSPSSRLFERVKSELGAGNLPADIVAIGDPSLVTDLDNSGLYAQYKVPMDGDLEPQYKSKNGTYYSFSNLANVFAYNTEVFKGTPPQSWADLANLDGTANRLGMVQAGASAGGWRLAYFMRQELSNGSDSYWRKIAATKPLIDTSTGSLTEKLSRGEIAIALARPPEVAGAQKDGAPLKIVWPSDGSPIISAYAGVTAKAPHPNAAKLYLSWLLSKRGQSKLAAEGGDYAIRTDAAPPQLNGQAAPPLADIKAKFAPDADQIAKRDGWLKEWGTVFGIAG